MDAVTVFTSPSSEIKDAFLVSSCGVFSCLLGLLFGAKASNRVLGLLRGKRFNLVGSLYLAQIHCMQRLALEIYLCHQ